MQDYDFYGLTFQVEWDSDTEIVVRSDNGMSRTLVAEHGAYMLKEHPFTARFSLDSAIRMACREMVESDVTNDLDAYRWAFLELAQYVAKSSEDYREAYESISSRSQAFDGSELLTYVMIMEALKDERHYHARNTLNLLEKELGIDDDTNG